MFISSTPPGAKFRFLLGAPELRCVAGVADVSEGAKVGRGVPCKATGRA
jgi:hypothetical protein